MLLASVILYILFSLAVGFLSSLLVKNSNDYVLAGRRLPLFLASSALFATWFGAETIIGASSEFTQHGIIGVIEDPFGAALCLLFVGLFFARPLYRMKLISLGDFYRDRFGKKVELVSSIFMIVSYFGWIAAQLVAFGVILNVISGLDIHTGMFIGTLVVLIYTVAGGMWAISITDFIQTIVIILGLGFLLFDLLSQAGGIGVVLTSKPPEFFNFLPEANLDSILDYIAAWMVIGLGSIPQQDVYQRTMAAKSEKVAVFSSFLASFMYLSIGLVPLILALCANVVYPEMFQGDSQTILPRIVLDHSNIFIQIMFFGAILSAIMSTLVAQF